jgi:tRNA threonylcarbamoyladenosine modification (KEOPS) complex Cgi121 subunit
VKDESRCRGESESEAETSVRLGARRQIKKHFNIIAIDSGQAELIHSVKLHKTEQLVFSRVYFLCYSELCNDTWMSCRMLYKANLAFELSSLAHDL